MNTRIYIIEEEGREAPRLVEAVSAAAALRHVVEPLYCARLADARDVARAMTAGATVETAGDPVPAVVIAKTKSQEEKK